MSIFLIEFYGSYVIWESVEVHFHSTFMKTAFALVIHESFSSLCLEEQRMDCRKDKTSLFTSNIDRDQCLNGDLSRMTILVIVWLERGTIDCHHNCVNTVLFSHNLGLLVSLEISCRLWWSIVCMPDGLSWSVQQLVCGLEIWGLVDQFLVGTGDFFLLESVQTCSGAHPATNYSR
jgi:hypothetical protein